MPLVPNFSISQNYGSIDSFTITDTSTGSDAGLTLRLIYLQKYDGDYLVPDGTTTDYIVWPIGDSSLLIEDVLDKDYCLDITVQYFTGSSVTYTKTRLVLFSAYSELFLRQLTQQVAANRLRLDQNNYWFNKLKLRTLIDDAEQAVTLLNDQTTATFCLDEAKKLTDNISAFF